MAASIWRVVTAALAIVSTAAYARSQNAGQAAATIRIDAIPGHEINSFDPDEALGSSVDVLSHRDIDLVYTPHIIQESLSAGWGPITYRNNSELRMARGTGTRMATGATQHTRAAISPAVRNLVSRSGTFWSTRFPIAVSRLAVMSPFAVRT